MTKEIIHEDEQYRIFSSVKGSKGRHYAKPPTRTVIVVDKIAGTVITPNGLPKHIREKISSYVESLGGI